MQETSSTTTTRTKKKFSKKGAAATGVAAVALLGLLFGTGKLGFGTDTGLGDPAPSTGKEDAAVVQTVASTQENRDTTAATGEVRSDSAEIRIQGREYNYRNVTYGNSDHPLEELMEQLLKEFPSGTRIDLVVEDNATKNAVDDLEAALAATGFTDVHK